MLVVQLLLLLSVVITVPFHLDRKIPQRKNCLTPISLGYSCGDDGEDGDGHDEAEGDGGKMMMMMTMMMAAAVVLVMNVAMTK